MDGQVKLIDGSLTESALIKQTFIAMISLIYIFYTIHNRPIYFPVLQILNKNKS